MNRADRGVFQNHRVEKINLWIRRFDRSRDENSFLREIDIDDVYFSDVLLERLLDFGDYYVNDEWEYDEEMFERYVDVDFPGYKNLVFCVMLFRSKFEINYKSKVIMFNFSDSGSD